MTWGPTCAKVVSVLQKLLNIETLKDTITIYIYTHMLPPLRYPGFRLYADGLA